ncbi:hypothetical protein GCM10010320_34760 [Streptomyces caelestis]|nr:hypothetical protein GCM10010320_34760 [Streptomyces caelestis]
MHTSFLEKATTDRDAPFRAVSVAGERGFVEAAAALGLVAVVGHNRAQRGDVGGTNPTRSQHPHKITNRVMAASHGLADH